MYGESGNDTLVGGNGENGIAGGLGADTLTGGGAADGFFYFDLADSGRKKAFRDLITDFKQGSDKIYLNQLDANTVKGDFQTFKFRAKEGKALKKAGRPRLRAGRQEGHRQGHDDRLCRRER